VHGQARPLVLEANGVALFKPNAAAQYVASPVAMPQSLGLGLAYRHHLILCATAARYILGRTSTPAALAATSTWLEREDAGIAVYLRRLNEALSAQPAIVSDKVRGHFEQETDEPKAFAYLRPPRMAPALAAAAGDGPGGWRGVGVCARPAAAGRYGQRVPGSAGAGGAGLVRARRCLAGHAGRRQGL